MDLFVFAGDPEANARMVDVGVLPWWTTPELRIAFFRPLAALTLWLDYRLWPDSASLMHAHNLLWVALCVGAGTLLYRRIFASDSPAVAGVAACLFAIDSARGAPMASLATRNALVALFFGILAVLAHVRWRQDRWRPGGVVAPALLASALLRYLPVLILWRLLYVGMGYGVRAPSAYVDPAADPLRFIGALFQRGPVLLLGEWIDLDLMMWLLGAGRRLWLAGAVAAAVLGIFLLPLLRRDRIARFWSLGMLLSLVPICVPMPNARYLIFTGVGAAGLLAQLLATTLGNPGALPRWRRLPAILLCAFLVASRGVLAPVLLFVKCRPYPNTPLLEMALDRTVEKQTVVVLNSPGAVYVLALPFASAVEGRPVPFRIRGLAAGGASGTATRTDDRSLLVRVKGGYLTEVHDTAFRDPRQHMRPGQRIELTGMVVEVVTVKEDGRPWEVHFRFDVPLEHPSLRWLQWKGNVYAPFRPPVVGQAVEFTGAGVEPERPAS
jgi:hypothetical protein